MLCLWLLILVVVPVLTSHNTAGNRQYHHHKDRCFKHKGVDDPEAFTAVLFSNALKGVIRFENVLLDVGGSYNQFSGIFTAKTPGIYAFYWTAISELRFTKTELHVGSDVVGVAVSDLLPDAQFILDEVANTATVFLHAGDEVSIVSNNTLLPGSVFAGNRIRYVKYPSAFYARSEEQIVNKDDPTNFQEVLLDTTNGDFDGATFTTSTDGLYVISASASSISRQIDMDIDQNGGSLVEPDEEWEDDDALYFKSVSSTIVLRLDRQTRDKIDVRIDGNALESVPIDERTIFSGHKHSSADERFTPAITVAPPDDINFDCSLGCIAFSDNPRIILDVNDNFNVNTGEFIAPIGGVYGIAVSIDSRNITTTYNIEVSNQVIVSGRTNGPIIPPGSSDDSFNFSKRVIFQHLKAGERVKVTLTGTYRSGSSMSVWHLLHDY